MQEYIHAYHPPSGRVLMVFCLSGTVFKTQVVLCILVENALLTERVRGHPIA